MKSSSSGLNFSVVSLTGSRLLKASKPGLAVVSTAGSRSRSRSRWRTKVIGSGSGWGMMAGKGRKSAVVVTLNLGLGVVRMGLGLVNLEGLLVLVFGRATISSSFRSSSSSSSIAKLGLVRKRSEALRFGEVVVDSGTAGVILKVVTLNWSPDTDSSSAACLELPLKSFSSLVEDGLFPR